MNHSKQSLTIEVEVPEGYELTGEFRAPTIHDAYVCTTVPPKFYETGRFHTQQYPILRKAWKPPHWLPTGCWIYKHINNRWYATNVEPMATLDGFYNGDFKASDLLDAELTDFAKLHGGQFAPPSVNKLQIVR